MISVSLDSTFLRLIKSISLSVGSVPYDVCVDGDVVWVVLLVLVSQNSLLFVVVLVLWVCAVNDVS